MSVEPATKKDDEGKATGAKLPIFVYLGASPDPAFLRIEDNFPVAELKNRIKKVLKNTLGACDAKYLVVRTKDATDTLHLVGDDKLELAKVLKSDSGNKYRVYVEVPEAAAGLESTCVLRDSSGGTLPADAPLELHQIVVVLEDQRNQRDADFAPSSYVVTPQAKQLIEMFSENAKLPSFDQWHELCVFGTPGCGKSCAAKILEGEIRRRMPNARVFYSRDTSLKRLSKDQVSQIKQEATEDRPAFVVVDQMTKEEVEIYGNMAGLNLYVILLASDNFRYFYQKASANPPNYQKIHPFPFGLTGLTANAIMTQLQIRKGGEVKLPVLPADLTSTPFSYADAQAIVADGTDFETMFRWTNGHPLPLAEWFLYNRFPEELVTNCMKLIDVFVRETKHGCTFYFELFKALCDCQTNPTLPFQVSDKKQIDFRFIDEHGCVVSPFFLQAFENYLSLAPPPAAALDTNFLANLQNLQEEGEWVLERVCLTSLAYLEKSTTACLSLFPELKEFVPPPMTNFQQMPYRSLKDVDHELGKQAAPYYLHFMPIKVTQKSIDCLQIYSVKGDEKTKDKVVIIGHQVTRQAAQELDKSLEWAESTKEFALLPSLKGKELNFLLLFSCLQDPDAFFAEDKEFVDAFHKLRVRVADYPAAEAFPQKEMARLFGLTSATYGARELAVIEDTEPTSPNCHCGGTKCGNKRCGCVKQKKSCTADCACKLLPAGMCMNQDVEAAAPKKARTA